MHNIEREARANSPARGYHQSNREAADVGASEPGAGNQRSAYATTAQGRTVEDVGGHGPSRRAAAT
jgi:hypothetical protein